MKSLQEFLDNKKEEIFSEEELNEARTAASKLDLLNRAIKVDPSLIEMPKVSAALEKLMRALHREIKGKMK